MSDKDSNTQPRSVHRPITINVEDITDLPTLRELPQDTQMTINLKMNKVMALKLIDNIQHQLGVFDGVDFVAITITGVA